MLEHGGRLLAAARRHGIPPADWLDISTGIAPWPYPLPAVPAAVWQRLPEADDGLEAIARGYYGAGPLLALPGSQAAIQALPRLLLPGRVAVAAPIYGEHPAAWAAAGHRVVPWDLAADYGVLCNPNNPDGRRRGRAELLARARDLRLLVVDEAFADPEPGESLLAEAGGNIVVLRSLGKFFGLAGARVGFAIGDAALLSRLAEALGPWPLAHPARWAAGLALSDGPWQVVQRHRLIAASSRLEGLLRAASLGDSTGTALFRYLATPRAGEIHEGLARQGILTRLLAEPAALRFGLPGDEVQWQRLERALATAA